MKSLERPLVVASAVIISCFCASSLAAQGCSDAGFCTMGALKPDQSYSKKLNIRLRSIEVGQYIGVTRFEDVIFNYWADLSFGINEKTTLQVKAPFAITRGFLDNTNGFGDISLGLARNLVAKENYQLNLTLGGKIPTGNSNVRTSEGRTLAMYYQPGLGTWDVVAGLSFITRKWLLAVGYQQSLNPTTNRFLWSDWEGTRFEEDVRLYTQSLDLERGIDAMFRIERNFRLSNFNLNLGLLHIYRFGNDVITLPNGEKNEVQGSDGLAWTALVGFGYQLSVKSGIKVMNGIRLRRRPKNPDGLSRELVSTISYVYKF